MRPAPSAPHQHSISTPSARWRQSLQCCLSHLLGPQANQTNETAADGVITPSYCYAKRTREATKSEGFNLADAIDQAALSPPPLPFAPFPSIPRLLLYPSPPSPLPLATLPLSLDCLLWLWLSLVALAVSCGSGCLLWLWLSLVALPVSCGSACLLWLCLSLVALPVSCGSACLFSSRSLSCTRRLRACCLCAAVRVSQSNWLATGR